MIHPAAFQPAPKGSPRLRIAVVGSGIAGLSAAWRLSAVHDVTLFEKDPRLGGHASTVFVEDKTGPQPVDTGFIVYNEPNYPNLTALFDHLGVATEASDMSFAASLEGGAFEYAGTGLDGLFGQRRNLVNPRLWRMTSDILRFYRETPDLLTQAQDEGRTLGDYLTEENYSAAFIQDHILPMAGAIWSASHADMLDYPLAAFVRFFQSHGLLQLSGRPSWRTVTGGSRTYVEKLLDAFRGRIIHDAIVAVHRQDPVTGTKAGDGVRLTGASGHHYAVDHVVLATHADQALNLLKDAGQAERDCLSSFRYSKNETFLHTDETFMPKKRRVWASWNTIECEGTRAENAPVCVSYWMNRLQNIKGDTDYFVTLNPPAGKEPNNTLARFTYEHPLFDRAALTAQKDLWALQGQNRTWFCGSYFGYGFHEDALQSGLAVAEAMGAPKRPWKVPGENARLALPLDTPSDRPDAQRLLPLSAD